MYQHPFIMFNYNAIATELHQAGIPKDDIYFFEKTPFHKTFLDFFYVFQSLLVAYEKELQIQPARFFYKNDVSINAFAGNRNGYNIIGINSGLIIKVTQFFFNQDKIAPLQQFTSFREFEALTTDSIQKILRDFCVKFTFDHEYAHLIQMNLENVNNELKREYEEARQEINFDLKQHILEFDADRWGSIGVATSVYNYWKFLPLLCQSENALNTLTIMALVSVLCKFTITYKGQPPIYYKEYKHPHPLKPSLF